MNESTHIIEKVVVEVNTDNQESADFIKNNISGFLEKELFPRLEKILGEYNQTGRVVRFNSLNLDVATLRFDSFKAVETEITSQLAQKLKEAVGGLNGKDIMEYEGGGIERISAGKNRESAFLFFLEHGYLPWFGREEYIAEITELSNWQKSLESSAFLSRLENILQKNSGAMNRLILQFGDKIVWRLLLKSEPGFSDLEKDAGKIAGKLAPAPRYLFLQFLVSAFIGNLSEDLTQIAVDLIAEIHKTSAKRGDTRIQPVLPEMKKLIRRLGNLPHRNAPVLKNNLTEIQQLFDSDEQELEETKRLITEKSRATKERFNGETKSQEKDKEEQHPFFEDKTGEIAVKNAGVVLLHPFLKQFFKTIKITDEHEKIMDGKRNIAVHALHFLATGEDEFFEGNLVFCKFLCGVPLKMPAPRKSLLTNYMKEEANRLLKETIKHWPALKNTSPDGLRQMFLQRDGKLFKNENNFKLIVERKAQDILLDKLAWNISLVKLPWSGELLYIEW